MKLKKSIAILAILGMTSLFASDINNINILIDQINETTDLEAKGELMKNLERELENLDEKDSAKAKELVSQKLQLSKES